MLVSVSELPFDENSLQRSLQESEKEREREEEEVEKGDRRRADCQCLVV